VVNEQQRSKLREMAVVGHDIYPFNEATLYNPVMPCDVNRAVYLISRCQCVCIHIGRSHIMRRTLRFPSNNNDKKALNDTVQEDHPKRVS
jgi:hypothetical protein